MFAADGADGEGDDEVEVVEDDEDASTARFSLCWSFELSISSPSPPSSSPLFS